MPDIIYQQVSRPHYRLKPRHARGFFDEPLINCLFAQWLWDERLHFWRNVCSDDGFPLQANQTEPSWPTNRRGKSQRLCRLCLEKNRSGMCRKSHLTKMLRKRMLPFERKERPEINPADGGWNVSSMERLATYATCDYGALSMWRQRCRAVTEIDLIGY